MKELGEVLKKRRLEKKLTIDYVAEKIRVRQNYLELIESGNFQRSDIYMIGYVKNYSAFLGVDCRQYLDTVKKNNINLEIDLLEDSKNINLQNNTSPSLTVVTISIAFIVITIGMLFFFKSYNYTSSPLKKVENYSTKDVISEIVVEEEEVVKKQPNITVANSYQTQLNNLEDVKIIIFKATKPTELSVFDKADELIARKKLEQNEIFEFQVNKQDSLKIFTNTSKSLDIEFK